MGEGWGREGGGGRIQFKSLRRALFICLIKICCDGLNLSGRARSCQTWGKLNSGILFTVA